MTPTAPGASDPNFLLTPALLPNGSVQIHAAGAAGRHVIEASTNLVDWVSVWTNPLPAQPTLFVDENAVRRVSRRFYRGRLVPLPADGLRPTDLAVLARDIVPFLVTERAPSGAWVVSVNGIPAGNSAVGRVVFDPSNPDVFAYRAPSNGPAQTVSVCVTDSANATLRYCATVRVSPLPGALALFPRQPDVPLGQQAQFTAGAEVVGVGFVPFHHGYWKLNGVPGADAAAGLGAVDVDGLYSAPLTMPDGLPRVIEVGFSLTPEGPVLASTPVRLVGLEVSPGSFVSLTNGPIGQIQGTLVRSDGARVSVPPAELTFTSGLPEAAQVDANGHVSVGDEYGRALIQVVHTPTGLADTVVVESRANVFLSLETYEVRTDDVVGEIYSGSALTGLEVTRPGVMLNLKPEFRLFRFFRADPFPKTFAAANARVVSFAADEAGVKSYDPDGPMPQPTGFTATLDRREGFVQFGDRPGEGTITIIYDDGYVRRERPVQVFFSRLELSASARGELSNRQGEALISEWIDFEVTVRNPRAPGAFVGRTPIRVTAAGEPFFVRHEVRVHREGLIQVPLPTAEFETRQYDFVIPATTDPELLPFEPRAARFRVSPRRAGRHRFKVTVLSDSGIAPQEVVVDVREPMLRVESNVGGIPQPSSVSPLVVENMQLTLTLEQPAPLPLFGGALFTPATDELFWLIRGPDGQTRRLFSSAPPVTDRPITVPVPLSMRSLRLTGPGAYTVQLGQVNRPELRSAPLSLHVSGPAQEGGLWPDLAGLPRRRVFDAGGQEVASMHQLAALHFWRPLEDSWTFGVPIDLTVQCYNGLGEPKRVGKRIIEVVIDQFSGLETSRATNWQIMSVTALDANVPRRLVPDRFGRARLTVTPPFRPGPYTIPGVDMEVFAGPANDFVFDPNLVGDDSDLPTETVTRLVFPDGSVFVSTNNPVAVGIADYESDEHEIFLQHRLLIPGGGVSLTPNRLPVPSARLRAAVASGRLPPEAAQARLRLRGVEHFLESLASGPAVLTAGPGVSLVSQQVEGDSLLLTVALEAPAFESGAAAPGRRTWNFRFPNQREYAADVLIEPYEIRSRMAGHDLLLNGAYGFVEGTSGRRFADATLQLEFVNRRDPTLGTPSVDLELAPSLHACWDADRDGIPDVEEDRNQDGRFTETDNDGGIPFRGKLAESPLIGFHRWGGDVPVGGYHRSLPAAASTIFEVYGNTADHFRLDRATGLLSAEVEPDSLPDFVSRQAGGELLVARVGGNVADVLPFTAYNLEARLAETWGDPQLDFASLSNSIERAYAAYGGFDPSAPLAAVAADPATIRPVAVYVDHEAGSWALRPEANSLTGFAPARYFAGVLDQFFLREAIGGYDNPTSFLPLGRDGRVRAYQRPGAAPTGTERRFFGLDLDGVLYDAGWISLPKSRFTDPNLESYFVGPTILDAAPNGLPLLALPVVRSLFGDAPTLTPQGLLARLGGSSGGFLDVSAAGPVRFQLEARTPGAELPGLHAGYLVRGRPTDLVDPRNSLVEDDIRDVLIKREGEPGAAAGAPIVQENRFFGSPAARWVNAFAQNDDKKEPLRTGLRLLSNYRIETDPPGALSDPLDKLLIRSALLVRERPAPRPRQVELLVTTQSEGNEQTKKILADFLVDAFVDVISGAMLGSMTRANYFECGSPVNRDFVRGAVINLTLGLMGSEFAPQPVRDLKPAATFLNKALLRSLEIPTNSLYPVAIPGITLPGVKSLLPGKGLTNLTPRQRAATPEFKISGVPSGAFISFCRLLNDPISRLKQEIKATYSAETFGGLGSAEAIGTVAIVVTIPKSAQRAPGLFCLAAMVSEKVQIAPREARTTEFGDLPWREVFAAYPFADEVSEAELMRVLLEKLNDPAASKSAAAILTEYRAYAVRRQPAGTRYRPYKTKMAPLPSLGLFLGPGMKLANGEYFGDFELRPGETEIPIATVAVVSASRSNENAGARASVFSSGQEVILHGAVIQKRPPPPAP